MRIRNGARALASALVYISLTACGSGSTQTAVPATGVHEAGNARHAQDLVLCADGTYADVCVNTPPGTSGGGGTGSGNPSPTNGDTGDGGGGAPVSKTVALLPPAPGLPCWGSDQAGLVLDNQLPLGSTGKNNDVNNIYYLYEPSTLSGSGFVGGRVVVGWIAVTANNYFIISNGKDGNLIHNLAQQVPILGQIWNAVNNTQGMSISPPLTGTQINQVFQAYPVNAKTGNGSATCFTNPLPASQWT